MNSTYPLEESILMDSVARSTRSRWKSLEAVSSFGWSGSAMLGGALADSADYRFTFLITAALQASGTLLLLLIAPLVPAEKSAAETHGGAEAAPLLVNDEAAEEVPEGVAGDAAPLLVN